MRKISTALLLAIQHIESRNHEEKFDDDIAALETIAAELQGISNDELNELKATASSLGLLSIIADLGI